jgi:hypothetical protein
MRPSDMDFREALNDPSWDEMNLQWLKGICDEKIMQLRRAKK